MTLKPCPFCGGSASFERLGNNRQSTIVSCGSCGARFEDGSTFNHEAGWNTRVSETPVAGEYADLIERLRDKGKHSEEDCYAGADAIAALQAKMENERLGMIAMYRASDIELTIAQARIVELEEALRDKKETKTD